MALGPLIARLFGRRAAGGGGGAFAGMSREAFDAARVAASLPDDDAPSLELAWLEGARSPFGVAVLDCRRVVRGAIATPGDQAQLDRFAALRGETGESLRAAHPARARTRACDLRYAVDAARRADGRWFSASRLECKWDIARWDDALLFTRSWSGDLIYRARLAGAASELRVVQVEARGASASDAASDDDDDAARHDVAAVDFLVQTYLLDRVAPFPIPAAQRDAAPREIALWGMRYFGRDARFGRVV